MSAVLFERTDIPRLLVRPGQANAPTRVTRRCRRAPCPRTFDRIDAIMNVFCTRLAPGGEFAIIALPELNKLFRLSFVRRFARANARGVSYGRCPADGGGRRQEPPRPLADRRTAAKIANVCARNNAHSRNDCPRRSIILGETLN